MTMSPLLDGCFWNFLQLAVGGVISNFSSWAYALLRLCCFLLLHLWIIPQSFASLPLALPHLGPYFPSPWRISGGCCISLINYSHHFIPFLTVHTPKSTRNSLYIFCSAPFISYSTRLLCPLSGIVLAQLLFSFLHYLNTHTLYV